MPLTDVRPPGIYSEPAERRHAPIALGKSAIPGFIGLAERGPTGVPVRVTGIDGFKSVFGDLKEGFLLPAIEAFFRNGGKECWVVRIVHHTGRSFGEHARQSDLRLVDAENRPCLMVQAASEGGWGNQVALSARPQPPRAQTFLTLDALAGDTAVTIRSTHGFRPGTLVRLFNERTTAFRLLTGVQGKTVRWADDDPLGEDMPASAPTYLETVEFELHVASPFLKESFADLSLHPASPSFVERVVGDRSALVRARALRADGGRMTDRDLPAPVTDLRLQGGHDGLLNVTPDDFIGLSGGPGDRSGLAALELIEEVDLLAAPDVMWLFRRNQGLEGMPFSTLKDVEVVQDAMIAQCERLSDRFALLDSPFPDSADRTREYRLMFDTRFASLYFPWVVMDRNGKALQVPPCGHVAGVIARCDEATGIHRPPANEVLAEAEDLTMLLKDDDLGYLNGEGINCLKSFGSRGLRIWGARTVSSDPQFRFMNVRRVLNALNKAMNNNLQWVVFEPNLPSLWKTITRNVTQFLMDLWRKGWFQGSVPEEAFFVKCDDETNPPEERHAGILTVEVGVAPVRPAEFVVLRLAQEMQATGEGGA